MIINKKIVILVVTLIILIPIGIFLLTSRNTLNKKITNSSPTTTPIFSSNKEKLMVVRVFPDDQSSDITQNQVLTITFNKNIFASDFIFGFVPEIAYKSTIRGNVLTVTPKTQFAQGTTYMYFLKYTDGSYSKTYSFTTINAPTINPTTGVDNVSQLQNDWNKQFQPDIYLNAQAPYSGATFSVESTYTSTPQEHFYFTVTLSGSDKTQDKQDFLNWLASLGLGQKQIGELDIRYQ